MFLWAVPVMDGKVPQFLYLDQLTSQENLRLRPPAQSVLLCLYDKDFLLVIEPFSCATLSLFFPKALTQMSQTLKAAAKWCSKCTPHSPFTAISSVQLLGSSASSQTYMYRILCITFLREN